MNFGNGNFGQIEEGKFRKINVQTIEEILKWSNKMICKLSQLIPTKLQWFDVFISYSGAKEQKC